MQLASTLADQLLRAHPERAAAVLERRSPADAVTLLCRIESDEAADVLRRLSPQRAAHLLATLPLANAVAQVASLPLDTAARLLRRLDDAEQSAVLDALDARKARSLRALLRFPENTAGALMDPDVLALPLDLRADEALALVREQPEQARYNLYVVDAEQRLIGALNLRELLLAQGDDRLVDLMVPDPLRLAAEADRTRVVSHPGWREVHSLPVVDASGHYLGAVRYRTLRELEEALLRGHGGDRDAAEALGELFATGAAALLDAFTPAIGGNGRER